MFKKWRCSVLLVVVVCFSGFKSVQVPVAYIVLQNDRLNITPTEFYIHHIDDERRDNTSIGALLPVPVKGKSVEAYKVDFKGGIAAIKNFMDYSLPVNKTLRPLVIKLKAFNITETALAGGRADGHITISVAFGLLCDEDFVPLGEYTGGAQYQRPAGTAQQTEPMLRSTLNNSIVYINNWMNAQADKNAKLAKGVTVNFTDYKEGTEGDTIYYDIKRPLKWADFEGKPRTGSRNGAEIFAGIGYNEDVDLKNGIFKVELSLKVYVPKSACWVNTGSINNYSLNHEQRHFDIAKLVSEHFKKNVAAEHLPPHNYDGPINVLYLDALREMNKLQKQYDDETGHSINSYQQQQWNMRIDKELQKLGIKTSAD
jgi:hypothetical protein